MSIEIDKVKAEQVIVCTKSRRGSGNHPSPIRIVTEIFDFDGNLIADNDPKGDYSVETILDFLKWHYKEIPVEDHVEKISAYFIEGDDNEN